MSTITSDIRVLLDRGARMAAYRPLSSFVDLKRRVIDAECAAWKQGIRPTILILGDAEHEVLVDEILRMSERIGGDVHPIGSRMCFRYMRVLWINSPSHLAVYEERKYAWC